MNANIVLKYKNILLRPVTENDLEILRTIRNDKNVSKYLSKINYISKEDQINWYKDILTKKDEIIFAIEEIDEFKRCVGSCSLYEISQKKAVIGKIAIDPECRRRKIGLNAMIRIMWYAFSCLRVDNLFCYVYSENKYAIYVYEKIGFELYEKYIDNQQKGEMVLIMNKDKFINKYSNEML